MNQRIFESSIWHIHVGHQEPIALTSYEVEATNEKHTNPPA